MALGNQGKGSRFADKKQVVEIVEENSEKNLDAPHGRESKLPLKLRGFKIDKNTFDRLQNYVVYKKQTAEDGINYNNSYVVRVAIAEYLAKKGF
ncbi:hypothetical protein [Pseudodesulfovibrio senegalensis]|uniref:Uncharacterized protein n=1 Tax=Pseudodesulfovibrio senegalensis TaxID=1721087 RepID=A0A6N6MY76_9BACT|nr:hypothetical protein [Pseudodesulfovibrio senegalensis]KAB1437323.1 hypothetical protein F8A88_15465 [Pseudodesulfovibrio senegalensis]